MHLCTSRSHSNLVKKKYFHFFYQSNTLDLLYGEHHKRDTMIDLDDLNEDDLFNSINETLLAIEELGELDSSNSSEILSS